MERDTLIKKLKLAGKVETNRDNWNLVGKVVSCIANNTAEVLQHEWESWKAAYPDLYKFNLSIIGTWSTYEGCSPLTFSMKGDQLICKAKIYDGDNMYGDRKEVRFTAKIILPIEFIDEIEKQIDWAFESLVEDAYDLHLANQRKNWIEKTKIAYLK